MLKRLFAPITAAEAQKQRERIAQEHKKELETAAAERAAARAAAPPPAKKRCVGRPARAHEPAQSSAAAASADATDDCDEQQSFVAVTDSNADKVARGQYMNWFATPYVSDIITAYRYAAYSARTAVSRLRAVNPERYKSLSFTTVHGWFDKQHCLLPKYAAQLANNAAAVRYSAARSLFDRAPDGCEERVQDLLLTMRAGGAPINTAIIRCVITAVMETAAPALLAEYQLSQSFCSRWARKRLLWTWRSGTTAASKLPVDWEAQGIKMAQRIAAAMELHAVHPSLVINLDQTGVRLVPSGRWSYEERGSKAVAIVGAEDKRQFTACVASSLDGELLPLQLIFAGKTARCLPPRTADALAARVHVTFSDNHWSSQETMQQYVEHVVLPYASRCIVQHELRSDAHVLLVLDVWSVHKSEEFRAYLRDKQPRVHLVFVPANCTSRLQVADVALQRPFKAHITDKFQRWTVDQMKSQIDSNSVVGIAQLLRMATIKPLAQQWCIDSWNELRKRRSLITDGWAKCCTKLYDVLDRERRIDAVKLIAATQLDADHVPTETDEEQYNDHAPSGSDSDEPGLDLAAPRRFGTRRSGRVSKSVQQLGYRLNTEHIECDGDEE